jgi:hypothetical protein
MNHTNTEEGTSDTGSPVLAMLVAEAERLDFLPRHFGRQMMTFETAVYAQMRLLSTEYSGGYWDVPRPQQWWLLHGPARPVSADRGTERLR